LTLPGPYGIGSSPSWYVFVRSPMMPFVTQSSSSMSRYPGSVVRSSVSVPQYAYVARLPSC
jgi:hypothetical protein